MAGNSMKVAGIPELLKKLGFLGERETIEKISYRATFGVSKDLREGVQANMESHRRTGAMARAPAIKRIVIGTKRGYTVGMRAGASRNRRSTDDPSYWWLLEFGTRYIAPFGFFRRAFADIKSRAPGQIIAAGRKAVLSSGNRALNKFGKGGKK